MEKCLLKTWTWVFGDADWPTAPPKIVGDQTSFCLYTLQGEGGKNGISKQSENFASYGWKEAS